MLLFSVVVILSISCVYLFIPSTLRIAKTVIGASSLSAVNRCFADTANWNHWLPSGGDPADKNALNRHSFSYNGISYDIARVLNGSIRINIHYSDKDSVESEITTISLNADSSLITWSCNLSSGINPFNKIMRYRHAAQIKENMDTALYAFRGFLTKTKNIYGIDFHEIMSKDFALVTMTSLSDTYPGTEKVYGLIDSLRQYISLNGATEVNYPMLNISQTGSNQFKMMVAISINKEIHGNKDIILKRFVPWKMIEGEVKGGVYTINRGFEQLNNFKDDHQNTMMAIPFQSLITDRRKEADTGKWITKICAPVMR
ncbi:MAG TPA: hypothetical protein VHZ50_07540 [Puia sp.]|nr:hypothetical protein [Puia sp.]